VTVRTKKQPDGQQPLSFIEMARRAQIIACAIQTIATLGYTGASLAQIAKRAGTSKSVILYHFASKEELLRQVVTEIYTASAVEMGRAMAATPHSTRDLLHTYIRSSLTFMAEHRTEIRVLGEIFLNLRRPTGELTYGMADEEPLLAPLEQGFRIGQAAGEFRPFDTRVMALTLRAAIDKYSAQLGTANEIDLDTYIREVTELFDYATRSIQE
jgi:TetR/AcrR family fatty acid metabolism transcriptional regulator